MSETNFSLSSGMPSDAAEFLRAQRAMNRREGALKTTAVAAAPEPKPTAGLQTPTWRKITAFFAGASAGSALALVAVGVLSLTGPVGWGMLAGAAVVMLGLMLHAGLSGQKEQIPGLLKSFAGGLGAGAAAVFAGHAVVAAAGGLANVSITGMLGAGGGAAFGGGVGGALIGEGVHRVMSRPLAPEVLKQRAKDYRDFLKNRGKGVSIPEFNNALLDAHGMQNHKAGREQAGLAREDLDDDLDDIVGKNVEELSPGELPTLQRALNIKDDRIEEKYKYALRKFNEGKSLNDLKSAVGVCLEAIKLNPQLPNLWFLLAACDLKLADLDHKNAERHRANAAKANDMLRKLS